MFQTFLRSRAAALFQPTQSSVIPQAKVSLEVWCDQHRFRKRCATKAAIAGLINPSKKDCGPGGILWRWFRDRKIRIKKQKNYI